MSRLCAREAGGSVWHPQQALPEDEEHIAYGIASHAGDATNAVIRVFEESLAALLYLAREGAGDVRRSAATALIDHITGAIKELATIASAIDTHDIIRHVAENRIEFPVLLSRSRRITRDFETLVIKL